MPWVDFALKPFGYHARQIFKKGYKAIEGPEGVALLSPKQRRFVERISRTVNLPSYLRRKAIGSYIVAKYPAPAQIQDGFARFEAPAARDAVVAACERQIALYRSWLKYGDEALTAAGVDPAAYFKETVKTDDDPLKHIPYKYNAAAAAEIARFCMRPEFLAPVARYLGVLPILTNARILYSPNAPGDLSNAQLFHLDPEGARQVKLFMALREVTPDSGPFTFVPAAATMGMLESGDQTFQKRRVKDKHILKHAPRKSWVSLIGASGSTLLVDTSNCFHFGSRPGSQPRLLLYAQYLDPFCSYLPASNARAVLAGNWANLPPMPGRWSPYLLGRRI